MQLREVMRRDTAGVEADMALADALLRLHSRDGEPLPVYDNGQLVGVLTDRDVVAWEAKGGGSAVGTKVRDVMRHDIPFCYEDQDVREAAEQAGKHHAEGLVVLRPNRQPAGTVSLADLATGISDGKAGKAPPPARIMLQPVAAPSILGLFGFAGATFIVAANMAGWYGTPKSAAYLFPFAAFFGGLAQFLAGMWSYKARDALATAMHGMWGSFWMGYGVLQAMIAFNVITEPQGAFPELGFWFIALAAITWSGAFTAVAENLVVFTVLGLLAAGSTIAAYAFIAGDATWKVIAGNVFVASACAAWYCATAMMLESGFKRVILPLGKYKAAANTPGKKLTIPVQYEDGQPGVKVGQ